MQRTLPPFTTMAFMEVSWDATYDALLGPYPQVSALCVEKMIRQTDPERGGCRGDATKRANCEVTSGVFAVVAARRRFMVGISTARCSGGGNACCPGCEPPAASRGMHGSARLWLEPGPPW